MSPAPLTDAQEHALLMLERAALFLDLAMTDAVREHLEPANGYHTFSLTADQFDALDHSHASVFEAVRDASMAFRGHYTIGARSAQERPTSAAEAQPDTALQALAVDVEKVNARCAASLARFSAAERLRSGKKASPDLAAAIAEVKAAGDAWSSFRDQIVNMPARTLAGLRVKVMACGPDPECDIDMMRSVAADILASDRGLPGALPCSMRQASWRTCVRPGRRWPRSR